MKTAGVLLAAGEGRRFGGPKALVELDGELFVERGVRLLADGGCDEVVVVLGAPQVGTRLMQASARTGLDLPLRVLVWDDGGTTRLAHHDPAGLGAAHRLDGLDEVLARMGAGLEAVVADAAAA